MQRANQGIILFFVRSVGFPSHQKLHVALSATKEDIIKINVIDSDLFHIGLYRYLIGTASGSRRKGHPPDTVPARGSFVMFTVQGDRYLFVRARPSPEYDGLFALKYRMVRKIVG